MINRFCRSFAHSLRILGALASLSTIASAAPRFVADQLLIKPAKEATEVDLHALLSFHGAVEVDRIPELNVRVVRVPEPARDKVLAALSHNPNVEFAEKDYVAEIVGTANDPYYLSGNEWHLAAIQAASAWDITTGNSSTVIAVVDTGANLSHPDLQGKLLPGYDFVNSDSDPTDDNGHGTGVAGSAAAASNNAAGVASVAWSCPVMPVKVMDATGSGTYSNIAKGINYAADHGARVINLSMGSTSSSSTLQTAVDYAWSKGVVIIAAAGNNGNNVPCYPAACTNVVAVSATNSGDAITSWSNYGTYVDLAAPGESILTTWGSDYAYVSGTSFSSPITAGVAALMVSIQPKLTNSQAVDLLLKNTDDIGPVGYDVQYGAGRLNASRAVNAAYNAIVSDTIRPIVSLSSPTNGAVVAGIVGINATASDNIGVVRMEVLIDDVIVTQGASNSLSYLWPTSSVTNGSHKVEARAYDQANNSGSALATVTVQNASFVDVNAPTATITSPTEGTTLNGTAKISVSATDNVGVKRVDLYLDGARFGTSTSATALFSWNTRSAARGAHKLQAYAYDAAGNTGASALVTVYTR